MIIGVHTILYSKNADADRVFLRDILGFANVDAGHGWLIFALPPGEAAVHPSDESGKHELYLMTDNLEAEMAALKGKGVVCTEPQTQRWGVIATIALPGGGKLGLYEPRHPLAIKP